MTANILAHNDDLEGVREYFAGTERTETGCTDHCRPGNFYLAKEICPEIERHISTQANNTNYGTYQFLV